MSDMDLIPSDYRQNINRHQYLRKFMMLCALVLFSIGLIKILLSYMIWRENVQVVRLEQQENILVQNKAKTESYKQQKHVTAQQLAALNELRGGDRVALFLEAVDTAYRNGVWFDSVHFMRETGTTTLNLPGAANTGIIVVPNGAESKQNIDFKQRVEILGHALNHTLLAEFMRTLGAQPSITDLQLIDTGTRNYTSMQVIDFNLALQMDKLPIDMKVQTQP